jgi:hypothetical protein
MLSAAMQADRDLFFERGEVSLKDFIEVNKLAVGVIDDFNLRGLLCEENRDASEEGFAIEPMVWDETGNDFGKRLLAAVIRKWSFHTFLLLRLEPKDKKGYTNRAQCTGRAEVG